jgi:hypothetical protein
LEPQGQVCLTILATYNTAGVKTTPAYTEAFEPLGKTTVFSRKVCLYKLTKQANAQLDFDMCTNNKCEWRPRLITAAAERMDDPLGGVKLRGQPVAAAEVARGRMWRSLP